MTLSETYVYVAGLANRRALIPAQPHGTCSRLPKTSGHLAGRSSSVQETTVYQQPPGAKQCHTELLKTQLCVLLKTKQKQPAFPRLSPLSIRAQYLRNLP